MGGMTQPKARKLQNPTRRKSRRKLRGKFLGLRGPAGAALVAAGGAALAVASGAVAQSRSLIMLDQLESGSWELRERGVGGVVRNVCVRGGRELIQLHHQGLTCKSVVVQDTPVEVVVQYTCAGQGFGRTRIRRETNALIQIDTQGIASGQPYSYAGEGRRTGACRD